MSFTVPDEGPGEPEDPGGRQQPGYAAPDPGEADSGSQETPVEISDPRALRALAHPARLAILQHLVLDGPATATECAEVAGLSPSACSYHLRQQSQQLCAGGLALRIDRHRIEIAPTARQGNALDSVFDSGAQ